MPQVLIIGAGVTGLTLAIELLRRGTDVRIVDFAEEYFVGSRGKGIQPRTLELLDLAGLADEVMSRAVLYPFFKLHFGPVGIKAWSLGTRDPATEDRPYPNLMMLAQSCTEQILRARVEALGGKVELGTGIEGLSQSADEVKATLTTGEVATAEYAVACDGGRSTTRHLLGLKMIGSSVYAKISIVADLEIEISTPSSGTFIPCGGTVCIRLHPCPAESCSNCRHPNPSLPAGWKRVSRECAASAFVKSCGNRDTATKLAWSSGIALGGSS